MKKRKELVFLIFLLFLIIIFQSTLLKDTLIWGVKPNLVLVVIISLSVFINIEKAAVLGCLAGLFQDMFLGKLFGIFALVYLYIGILASLFKKRFTRSNFIFNMIYTFLFSLLASTVIGLISSITVGRFIDFTFFIKIIMMEALLNGILSIFIFPLMNFISEKLKIQES